MIKWTRGQVSLRFTINTTLHYHMQYIQPAQAWMVGWMSCGYFVSDQWMCLEFIDEKKVKSQSSYIFQKECDLASSPCMSC